ncbi:putative D-alanyl-D-alanine carboxypeptidase [Flavihumibacter petaseus NBRC 106054]|uniref:Putative D-alanyl-D-alanine carboxypeptidase n=2 Tax=Flavihumibacter TaxID=1004301 RepID=A0A0E9N369_9BACT|nr:putative D-alanyl-D-alanine carboxypeptidase [Flavihumibacter petaseus NBRC 106054]
MPAGWQKAIDVFSHDTALRYAGWSVVVADANTGKILTERQGDLGLPAASTQKIFTSIAAYALLGRQYQFETKWGYTGNIRDGVLSGDLVLMPSGDPSFGSWRYAGSRPEVILDSLVAAVKKAGIVRVTGKLRIMHIRWENSIPDGWIWQDIGNYYGAGAYALNWRENQFDLVFESPDKIGEQTKVISTRPAFLEGFGVRNEVLSGAAGSGDNSIIYLAPGADSGWVSGTIPVREKGFEVSGSLPDPERQFLAELRQQLNRNGVPVLQEGGPASDQQTTLWTYRSPPLDSLNYWFLRKSINLYGEALLKAIAGKAGHTASTASGVEVLRNFWQQQGIDQHAIMVIDGSGLSPQNRITCRSLVSALLYAAKQPWFPGFYASMPVYNGMRLKSGSISGSRAFAGYHRSANGREYVLAVVANNYSCSSSQIVRKMFELLDQLK